MRSTDYVIIHVSEISEQLLKFWSGYAWTEDIEKAKTYETYGLAVRTMWSLEIETPADGVRLMTAPKADVCSRPLQTQKN
jgi:hypothetical protein